MRSLVFKYSLYHSQYPSPVIPLEIKGKFGWREIWGYVDSGASVSILSPTNARRLGIKLRGKPQSLVTVGDGSQIPVYLHKLHLKLGHIKFRATIGFSPRLGVGFSLIGRKDIFDRFDVTFSDSKRQIRFKPLR